MIRARLLVPVACLAAWSSSERAHAAVWTPIQSGTTDDVTAIEFQSPKRAWFTTATGAIYTRRADGSFLATRTPSGIPLRDIEFQPGGLVGLAGGDQGQLLRSDDGGLSWKPVESVYASGATPQELAECFGTLIGDIRRIRFSGLERAILFGTGGQVAVSAESIATVGRSWNDPRTRHVSSAPCIPGIESYSDAFFVPEDPDRGYLVGAPKATVTLTSDFLSWTPTLTQATAGAGDSVWRRLAGDTKDPRRMWSTAAIPGLGMQATALTNNGWTTARPWGIGNPQVRAFPALGPADVAFADGTVLAAGAQGLILTSVDGTTFFYNEASGVPLTDQWSAVDLADAQHGVVAGAGGRILYTDQADVLPVAVMPEPPPAPAAPRAALGVPSITLSRKRARVTGRRVVIDIRGALTLPRNVEARTACRGTVQVSVRVRARVTARDATLNRKCAFSKTFILSRTKIGRAKKLAIAVRFPGNTLLKRTTKSVTVKITR